MLLGNVDGNSENKNAESGDNNSLEALQKQNVEMRSESSERRKKEKTRYQKSIKQRKYSN